MTASLNLLEDQNNHLYSNIEEIKNNIITDPNLIPNGLHQPEVNNNAKLNSELSDELQEEEELNNKMEEKHLSVEEKISEELENAHKNRNSNDEMDNVIELSKKKTNTYAAELISKYTHNNSNATRQNEPLEKVREPCQMLSEIMTIFPLSIIILLMIFVILLIVCMQV